MELFFSQVTGFEKSFQDIMKAYRVQPQAMSHIYRSVLLTSRRRRESGESTGSSRTSTPTMDENSKQLHFIYNLYFYGYFYGFLS